MTVEKKDVYKAMWWLEHQRIFFFGAFVAGTLLILTLKSLNVHGGIISLFAVGMMLAYAATGIKNKLKVRLDVLGDNLYYLGFLYTLVSLSYSLYSLGKGIADINNLLENFGLAIMTTLCGLALRVFFNQPKADIAEYENTVRLSLTEATANFVAEASKIGTDISTLRTVLSQVVQETQDTQRASNQTLSQAVEDQISLLDTTRQRNQENIENLFKKLEEIQDSFAQNFDVNTKAMKKVMTTSMSQIEKGTENFTSSFSNITTSIDELGKNINFITNILQTWDAKVEKLLNSEDKIQEKIRMSSENLNIAQINFNQTIESMPERLSKALSAFENILDNVAQRTARTEKQLEHNWTHLNTIASDIVTEIAALLQQIEERNLNNINKIVDSSVAGPANG